MKADPPTIFLSAGESSGDEHGARLAREILTRAPGSTLVGLGGDHMRRAGVELLEDLDVLAVMGLVEVVRSLPGLLRLRRRVGRFLAERDVDLFLPIDYPGFNLSVARHAHRRGISVLYYIAPQVWAWRRSRARKLANHTDLVCTVLPFEKEVLEPYGARVRFVGHPLLDDVDAPWSPDGAGKEPETRTTRGGAGGPVLGLFPGSRAQEVERMLPPFLEAARRLKETTEDLAVLVARAPHLPRDLFRGSRQDDLSAVRSPRAVMAASTAALTKSGTVTLQLALTGVPMVVGYRVHPLTFRVARRLVDVEHVALVNLVAERRVVPELLQHELTPDRLVQRVRPLLDPSTARRRRMVRDLAEIRDRLGEPGCAGRVADEAMRLLKGGGAA